MKALPALFLAVLTGVASAASVTTTMPVTASFANACAITATTPLNFGTSATGLLVPLETTATITLNCQAGQAYTVGLTSAHGAGPLGEFTTNGEGTDAVISYNVYQDSAHSLLWGSIASGNGEAGTGTGSPQTLTLYGQIPAGNETNNMLTTGQPLAPQTGPGWIYADTITVTVDF